MWFPEKFSCFMLKCLQIEWWVLTGNKFLPLILPEQFAIVLFTITFSNINKNLSYLLKLICGKCLNVSLFLLLLFF